MFIQIWLGIILSGGPAQIPTAPSTLSSTDVPVEVRPAIIPAGLPEGGIVRGIRNPDYDTIPKIPPPGAKIVYSSVPISKPYIAMTFDDGPHKTNTPRLLDLLKERNIKATFFVVGTNAREYPDIIRRILAEGHEIGNHTWDHKSLTTLSADRTRVELSTTDAAVVAASGYHMRIMRPPYGATSLRIKQECLDEFGYNTILWSVDPVDWKRPGSAVVEQRILAQVHPGAIILSHDIHEPTIDAMPDTLDALLTKGYHFVTVSQLLNIASQEPPKPTAPLAAAKALPVASPNSSADPAPAVTTTPAATAANATKKKSKRQKSNPGT
jgi:peptidoglycan-N-acetylglucosamine deacetylase